MNVLKSVLLTLAILFATFSASAQEVQLDGAWQHAFDIGNHNYLTLKGRAQWWNPAEEAFFFTNAGYMFGDKKAQGGVNVGSFHTTHDEHALVFGVTILLDEYLENYYLFVEVDTRIYHLGGEVEHELYAELEFLYVFNEAVALGLVFESLVAGSHLHELPIGVMAQLWKVFSVSLFYEPVHQQPWYRLSPHGHSGGPH